MAAGGRGAKGKEAPVRRSDSAPGREFVVVDVETTGLDARGRDRIVEIAVVVLDGEARVQEEFSSLVDPQRPMALTAIHGISAADVTGAPAFAELAPQLADLLAGRVFVAHNAPFDTAFVGAGFERAGRRPPWRAALCTFQMTRALFPTWTSHALASCVARLGVEHEQPHAAASDALATAAVLQRCLTRLAQRGGTLDAYITANAAAVARPARRGAA